MILWKDVENITVHENAKFTCERLVQEYIENGSFKGMLVLMK